jgi:hypothetical protein
LSADPISAHRQCIVGYSSRDPPMPRNKRVRRLDICSSCRTLSSPIIKSLCKRCYDHQRVNQLKPWKNRPRKRMSAADRLNNYLSAPTETGCREWTRSKNPDGYGHFTMIFPDGVSRTITAHRAAWLLANGEIPDGLSVLHHCDNRPCAEITHLYLGTAADNARDMYQRNRHPRKPNDPSRTQGRVRSKLSNRDATDIKTMLAASLTVTLIARAYRVSRATILRIKRGEAFADC